MQISISRLMRVVASVEVGVRAGVRAGVVELVRQADLAGQEEVQVPDQVKAKIGFRTGEPS